MTKIGDLTVALDFETTPTHTIDFDPSVDVIELEGRNGKYPAIPVTSSVSVSSKRLVPVLARPSRRYGLENGKRTYLALRNKTLVRQIQQITEACTLEITREGTSFATIYKVQRASKQTKPK